MSRLHRNTPPTTMGPAQREPFAPTPLGEVNGRQRAKDLNERIEGVCLGDPNKRYLVKGLIGEGKNLAEVAKLLGVPE